MSNLTIRSDFGFIGEDLELKKDISININEKGRIREIKCEVVKDSTEITFYKSTSLIIPGLINSHIHIGDSFARELGHNKQLIEVVAPPNGLKHKLLRITNNDIMIKGIKTAISEMLSYGTTYFIDYRENGLDGISILRNALQNSSIRTMILGRPTNDEELVSIYKEADGIGYASYKDISSKIKEDLRLMKKNFPGKLVSCHDAELERNEEIFNKIITEGLIDVIIHGTQYIQEDLEKLKQEAVSLVICPRSNGYFGVGFPPISKIFNLGIPISLGTDNVMVNNLDLFEELRYLYRINRVLAKNKEELKLTSLELLKMITINAAKNFRIEKDYGSLSEGKFADFFIVDLSAPNFYCFHIDKVHFYNLIVQRLNQNNIIKVFIGGNIVYERN